MTDLDAIHRAVLIDPGDMVARLAFADELEATGDNVRADFIRWGVQNHEVCFHPSRDSARVAVLHTGNSVRRNYDVLESCWRKWCSFDDCSLFLNTLWAGGFITQVAWNFLDFFLNAEGLFLEHPVVTVSMTDKKPAHIWRSARSHPHQKNSVGWACYPGDLYATNFMPYYLPEEIFSRLDATSFDGRVSCLYVDSHTAFKDLSRACVKWGRSLAGLLEGSPCDR
jgi:uncharacterized protein (TIGR02996 family)